MGPKLPVERICQPKPCLCTTHEFRCVVHKHGWDWKFCSIGSLGPIFCGRTTFLLCKQAPYHFWGLVIKIIDAKLIFVFLAQRQIWPFAFQDDENRLGINCFDSQAPNLVWQNFRQLNISPPPEYGGETPKSGLKTTKTMILHVRILLLTFQANGLIA